MKRFLKWVGLGLGVLAALVILAVGLVYALSARLLHKTYAVPVVELAVPSGPAAVAEGRRLATTRGCTGCHGARLEGKVMIDDLLLARVSAPNLTRLVPTSANAELERLIRHGVRKDGRSVLAMPSSMFAHLADADLGAIIAYLRTLPPVDHELPTTRIGPLARLGLVLGKYHPQAAVIDHGTSHAATAPTADRLAYGKYLGLTSCTECHGPDLEGNPMMGTPSLAVAAAYSDADFRRFLRTGKAIGDRELEGMSGVARRRFAHFTDPEVGALHAYLKTLAQAAP